MRAFASIQRTRTPAQVYAHRHLIAITVTLGCLLETLDMTIVNVATHPMMGSLGATLGEISWVATAYLVANAVIMPASGWLSDWAGRRRYFAWSVALFTAASLFCALSTAVDQLVFWRVAQGLGGGALMGVSQALIVEIYPPEEVGTGMGIFGVGVLLGPLLGPIVGGWIVDHLSWQWIFFINLPLGAAVLALTLVYVPDSPHAVKPQHVDFVGLLLLALSIGGLQLLLDRGHQLGWFESGEVVLLAVFSLGCGIAFLIQEWHHPDPVVDPRIFANRQFAASTAVSTVFGVVFFGGLFLVPVFQESVLGFTALEAGLSVLPHAVAGTVIMVVMAALINKPKIDLRPLIALGMILLAASFVLLSTMTLDTGTEDFAVPMILRGLGTGMINLPLISLCAASLAPRFRGVASGVFNLGRHLGASIGIAIVATLYENGTMQNRGELLWHLTPWSPETAQRLDLLTEGLPMRGLPEGVAPEAALRLLDATVSIQGGVLAFNQLMVALGVLVALSVPLLLLLRVGRVEGAVAAH